MRPAEIIPFPLPDTPEQQRALLVSLIDRLRPDQLELLSLIGRAFQPEVTEKVPDSPDAEVIRQCNRLNTIQTTIAAVCEEIPDGDEKGDVIGLLNVKWFEARSRLCELDGPHTLEGVRAAALVLLAQYPSGLDKGADLASWLSLRCAEYLVWELDDHHGSSSGGLGFQ